MRPLLAVVISFPLVAAIDNARVVGTTATQAVLSYVAPDTTACTVEVSEKADYSPVVHAVNGTLFSGYDSDGGGGRARSFVVGRRTVGTGSDSRRYSLALEANREHYYRITCGNDTATGTFRTTTIPLGNSHANAYPSDGSGGYLWPDINYTTRAKIIDPLTGAALYPVMMPRDYTTDATYNMDDCSGTNWAGVSPCGAVAGDSSYASATTTDPLLVVASISGIGYGQTGHDAVDFVQFLITGYGAGGTEAQRTVNVCLTRDNGLTCSAARQAILPASNGTMTVGTGTAGDLWETRPWSVYAREQGQGWARTASATPTTSVTFTVAADCQRLRAGSTIELFPDGSTSKTSLTISSLACPDALVNTEVNLYNEGKGVPFTFPAGVGTINTTSSFMTPNKGFGVKISKANADGQAIYIDNVRLTLGKGPEFRDNSGGFHNQCSRKDTDNGGWYKCIAANSGNPITEMYGIRTGSDGEPEIRNLGGAQFLGSSVGCSTTYFYPTSFGQGARPWDGVDPNVLWAQCGGALVKATFTNTSYTEKSPGGVKLADFTLTNLGGGYSIASLIQAFMDANGLTWEPYYGTGWSLEGVQGKYIIMFNRMGAQDSLAGAAVLDTGNGLPLGSGWVGSTGGTNPQATDGTGFVVAATTLWDRAASRWCTLHTYEWVGHEPVMCPEVQTVGKTTAYGVGPYNTTLTTSMPSSSADMDITVQSTWDTTTWRTPGWAPTTLNSSGTTVTPASGNIKEHLYIGSQIKANTDQIRTVTAVSGNSVTVDSAFTPDLVAASYQYTFPTQPAWWKPGDPIGARAPWALAPIGVGDKIQIGSEYLTVVSRTVNANDITLRVRRGTPQAHSSGASGQMRCNATYANYWYFTQDRNASTDTYYKEYSALGIGHGTYSNGIRVQADYGIQIDSITDTTNWNKQTHYVSAAPYFAGKQAPGFGNSYQKHPSNVHLETTGRLAQTFFDVLPFQGTNLFSPQNNTAATPVSGFNNIYKYKYTEQARAMNRKHFDTFGVGGGRPLKDISGPGVMIADSDRYRMCVADVAGECVSGSAAGDIYLNVPNLVPSYRYCAAGEVSAIGSSYDDACAGEHMMLGHSIAQMGIFRAKEANRVISDTNGRWSRVLATSFLPYRGLATTANAKPLPDASFLITAMADPGRQWMMAVKVPPLPRDDSVNRGTFVPIPVVLNPPSRLGVTNAIVEFGYDSNFHCTSRAEKCVANAAAITESNPFIWPASVGGDSSVTGVSCASGCTITIPASSQKILYYRWKYRDASNAVLAESTVQVVAVP